MLKMKSNNRCVCGALLLLLFCAFIYSCTEKASVNPGEDPDAQGPPKNDQPPVDLAELFNRFETEEVFGSEQVPNFATRIRFFPSSDETLSNQFLLTSKSGLVYHFGLEETGNRYFGRFTIPDVQPNPGDNGLTEVIFDPDFESNRKMYFCFSTGDNRWNRIVQSVWSSDYASVVNSLEVVLNVSRETPEKAWHGIFSMAFGQDGYLYTAMGDATQPELAQDNQLLLGKLIRIQPEDGGGYSIPPDNPYVGDDTVRDEILASGLRSPFRLLSWRDLIIIGDVGQGWAEEINIYKPGITNFGWPDCEGACGRGIGTEPVQEIIHHNHRFIFEDPEAIGDTRQAISLGVVYENKDVDPYGGMLDERLIFNDVYQGFVRAADLTEGGDIIGSAHMFHRQWITSMDTGPDGYVYGTILEPPIVFRIVLREEE